MEFPPSSLTGDIDCFGDVPNENDRPVRHMQVEFQAEEPVQIISLSAAYDHTFVISEGTQVSCLGNTKFYSCFEPLREIFEVGGERLVNIAPGKDHLYLLTDKGNIYAVGENSKGELGLGHLEDMKIPQLIPQFPLLSKRVISVASGLGHGLALTASGDVYAWGRGFEGQLGLGLGGQKGAGWKEGVITSPRYVKDLHLATIVKIDACHNASAALTSDGYVYTWGEGIYKKRRPRPLPIELPDEDMGRVCSFGIGACHVVLSTRTQRSYSLGMNTHGQLGLGKNMLWKHKERPMLIKELSGEAVTSVRCSMYSTAVLTAKGSVYTWGSSKEGRLGHPQNGKTVKGLQGKSHSEPIYVPQLVREIESKPVGDVVLGEKILACLTPTHITLLDEKSKVALGEGGTSMMMVGVGLYESSKYPPQVRFTYGEFSKVEKAEFFSDAKNGRGLLLKSPKFDLPRNEFPLKDVKIQCSLNGSFWSNACTIDVVQQPEASSIKPLMPAMGPSTGDSVVKFKASFPVLNAYKARARVVYRVADTGEEDKEGKEGKDQGPKGYFIDVAAAYVKDPNDESGGYFELHMPPSYSMDPSIYAQLPRGEVRVPELKAPEFEGIAGGSARLSGIEGVEVADVYFAIDHSTLKDYGLKYAAMKVKCFDSFPKCLNLTGCPELHLLCTGMTFSDDVVVQLKVAQNEFVPRPEPVQPASMIEAVEEEGEEGKEEAQKGEQEGEDSKPIKNQEMALSEGKYAIERFLFDQEQKYLQSYQKFIEDAKEGRKANNPKYPKGAFSKTFHIKSKYTSFTEIREYQEKTEAQKNTEEKKNLSECFRPALEKIFERAVQVGPELDAKIANKGKKDEESKEQDGHPRASLIYFKYAILATADDEFKKNVSSLPSSVVDALQRTESVFDMENDAVVTELVEKEATKYTLEEWFNGKSEEKNSEEEKKDVDVQTSSIPGTSGLTRFLDEELKRLDKESTERLEGQRRPSEGLGRGEITMKIPGFQCLGPSKLSLQARCNGQDFMDIGSTVDVKAANVVDDGVSPCRLAEGETRTIQLKCEGLIPEQKLTVKFFSALDSSVVEAEGKIINVNEDTWEGTVSCDVPELKNAENENAIWILVEQPDIARPKVPQFRPLLLMKNPKVDELALSANTGSISGGSELVITGPGIIESPPLSTDALSVKFSATVAGEVVEKKCSCNWRPKAEPAAAEVKEEEKKEGEQEEKDYKLSSVDRMGLALACAQNAEKLTSLREGEIVLQCPSFETEAPDGGIEAEVSVALDGQNFVKLGTNFKFDKKNK